MGQGSSPSNKRLSGRAGIKYYISCLGLSKALSFRVQSWPDRLEYYRWKADRGSTVMTTTDVECLPLDASSSYADQFGLWTLLLV
jgi:hypothetical protein